MTPAERVLRARLAAHTLHARRNSRELTAPARAAFLSSFERRVIEEAMARGEALPESEIERRAEHLKRAHFSRLALRSAQARRKEGAPAANRGSKTMADPRVKESSHEQDSASS